MRVTHGEKRPYSMELLHFVAILQFEFAFFLFTFKQI